MGKSTRRTAGVLGLALTGGVAMTMMSWGPGTTPSASAAALDPFDNCDELRDWYVDAVLPEVGPWGLGGWAIPAFFAAEGDMVATPRAAQPGTDEAVGNGETGTNVQEAGVDEPDVAKTNGQILVTMRNHTLHVFDVTGEEPVELGQLELGRKMWAGELLLVGDRVLVIGNSGGYYGGPVMIDVMPRVASPEFWGGAGGTTLVTVDVSDPSEPTKVSERTLDASLISARQYGDIVRIVTDSTPVFDWVYPNGQRTNKEARQENRDLVRESDAEDWLPKDSEGNPIMDCTDVSRPDDANAFGTISILTFDPANPDDETAIGVAADGDLVYSSTDRLYVATSNWGWDWGWGWNVDSNDPEPAHTDIYAFALDGADTSYVAAGEVLGLVPDRWAFSEYDGNLRVASTKGNGSESLVSILGENGDQLDLLGSVGGMGEGEDIKSVRWFGDVAVVVTFRTVDPLYTLDLSDPADPQVLGELKIPGFSEYLHPLGGDLLLGVGQHASDEGMTRGSQVSTFDLGDLTDPELIDQLRYSRNQYSPVEYDSRAFTYLPEHGLAFVPMGSWNGTAAVSVVAVGDDGSLETVASLPVDDGWAESIRVLPVDADHVAVVSNGHIDQIVDVTTL